MVTRQYPEGEVFDQLSVWLVIYGPLRLVLDSRQRFRAGAVCKNFAKLCHGQMEIVFKMDRYGNGEEIVLNKIFESSDHVPSFQHFDIELFAGMCVMAGSNFLPSVSGIGIAKAYSLVSKYQNLDSSLKLYTHHRPSPSPCISGILGIATTPSIHCHPSLSPFSPSPVTKHDHIKLVLLGLAKSQGYQMTGHGMGADAGFIPNTAVRRWIRPSMKQIGGGMVPWAKHIEADQRKNRSPDDDKALLDKIRDKSRL
ncbi:5'-3' exonuclease family protein [Actinidia rufa]|uniref:5'-3' exonuclease family protein n=1 Tax=Actinidia rufa TaxID=165716 RepID=A0A7J0GXE7_9ERIC|nr:5'-3' exonuclease family protein [Actinidia rufa]